MTDSRVEGLLRALKACETALIFHSGGHVVGCDCFDCRTLREATTALAGAPPLSTEPLSDPWVESARWPGEAGDEWYVHKPGPNRPRKFGPYVGRPTAIAVRDALNKLDGPSLSQGAPESDDTCNNPYHTDLRIERDAALKDARKALDALYATKRERTEPKVGEERLCLLCARVRPWGTWDSKTGATVCAFCRDAARSAWEGPDKP